jgi:hypothetical protein
MAEIKALWLAHLLVFQVVVRRQAEWRSDPAEAARLRAQRGTIDGQLRAIGVDSPPVRTQIIIEMEDWYHRQELCRLQAAMQSFKQAFYGRAAHTPQAKYAEARRAGHRALMMNHNPLLDGFPRLVEILREVCSGEVATYVTTEVQLPNDQFLDALEVIGRDRSDPAEVANPPARIRLSLSRNQRRRQRLERQRWTPLEEEPTSGLESLREVESAVIATLDWEWGRQDVQLPEEQKQAIEARFHGLKLQGLEALEFLGWDADRLAAVRRSLEPDRPWGKRLRKRFSAYDPERKSGGKH